METLFKLAQKRRSCYNLTSKSTLTDTELLDLLHNSLLYAPSAFNSQSTRAVLLLNKKHTQFWELVREELIRIIPTKKFSPTEEKIKSFAAAHGTILFFENWKIVEELQARFPTYKDNFPLWAYQANAMAEYLVWTALAERGIGASLQHYNPLIDEAVHHAFQIPAHWKLIAQMPFGVKGGEPGPKTFVPIEERVKVLH